MKTLVAEEVFPDEAEGKSCGFWHGWWRRAPRARSRMDALVFSDRLSPSVRYTVPFFACVDPLRSI